VPPLLLLQGALHSPSPPLTCQRQLPQSVAAPAAAAAVAAVMAGPPPPPLLRG
jgi:hypothetical protein